MFEVEMYATYTTPVFYWDRDKMGGSRQARLIGTRPMTRHEAVKLAARYRAAVDSPTAIRTPAEMLTIATELEAYSIALGIA